MGCKEIQDGRTCARSCIKYFCKAANGGQPIIIASSLIRGGFAAFLVGKEGRMTGDFLSMEPWGFLVARA